jgi:hypothetical protein
MKCAVVVSDVIGSATATLDLPTSLKKTSLVLSRPSGFPPAVQQHGKNIRHRPMRHHTIR